MSGLLPDYLEAHRGLLAFGGAAGDDAAMSRLRKHAAALGEGLDLSRCSDHEVIVRLRGAWPHCEMNAATRLPSLGRSTTAASQATAPSPAPAPAPRAVAAPAPAPAEGTFGANLDVEAMVAALRSAAAAGVPFCEECARAAASEALAA